MLQALTNRAVALSKPLDAFQSLVLLALRLYMARAFFLAGLVKARDWENTLFLFREEYKVPLLSPNVAALMGTMGELVFPLLLALGLAGRLGAAGLFFVNLMAVVSYPVLWQPELAGALKEHFYWGALLIVLLVFGPGAFSVDNLIKRRTGLR